MKSTSQEPFITSSKTNRWRPDLATAVWSGLVIVAAVLASRKLSGALTEQVSAPAGCLVATVTFGLSLSAFLLFQWTRGPAVSKPARIAAAVVTLVPPFVLGIILLPGQAPVATSYLVTLFLLSGSAVVVLGRSSLRNAGPAREPQHNDGHVNLHHSASLSPNTTIEASELLRGEPLGPPSQSEAELRLATDHGENNVSQWMTRSVTEEGREYIEGAVKIDFAPGQKQAMIHLPFYPPLLERPAVECESLDESDVRFKVAAVHPYGARIEAKRSGAAETAQTVEVGFTASGGRRVACEG